MDEKKLESLMKDEGFTAKLAETETKEEAQKLFADNGVQFTMEELDAIKKAVEAMGEDGELDESKLDGISGGCWKNIWIAVQKTMNPIYYGWRFRW